MLEGIIAVLTSLVTFILGKLSKKSTFIKNEFIPIQNLIVGITSALLYWLVTKDFSLAIMSIGLFTGGTYDIFHNLEKLLIKESSDDNDISNT